MGRARAEQPQNIAQKLRRIRTALNLTQDEMAKALEKQGAKVHRGYVGSFEIGERVPTLLITLAYARIAGIAVEVLIDDKIELPDNLRCQAKLRQT